MVEDTNDLISKDVVPMPVLLYGRPDCEGTARIREQLEKRRISFVEINVDEDPDAALRVEKINQGKRTTPTLVFGEGDFALVDPNLEELDRALTRAGYPV